MHQRQKRYRLLTRPKSSQCMQSDTRGDDEKLSSITGTQYLGLCGILSVYHFPLDHSSLPTLIVLEYGTLHRAIPLGRLR
jgi:hypothetical protein